MRIYCSGIGGIGLSAYGAYQNASGHSVAGSDQNDSVLLEDLRSQGITIHLKQDGSGVTEDFDLFVYSEAVPVDAPERVKAKELGIRSISYFDALGELSKDHFLIAVCGTHGKSSTTSMVARILIECGKDPSVIVGTKVRELDGRNWRKGHSDIFVVEACEYRRSFHYLYPDLIAVTNADGDHFDAYKDLPEYEESFVEFFKRLPEDGAIVFHGNDAQVQRLVSQSGRKGVNADGLLEPKINTPGEHMRKNARLALQCAIEEGIAEHEARKALEGFSGTWRRMETVGELPGGITVVDDYAHHPEEIRATLSAMREAHPNRRIVCVYQPHTHDRGIKLYDAFTTSFSDADLVLVTDVYVARQDIETGKLDLPAFVADTAKKSKTDVQATGSVKETESALPNILNPGDLLVCMGAGSIAALAPSLLNIKR